MSRPIKIILIILSLGLAISLFMVFRQLYDYYKGDQIYSEAMEIAGLSSLPVISTDNFPEIEVQDETEEKIFSSNPVESEIDVPRPPVADETESTTQETETKSEKHTEKSTEKAPETTPPVVLTLEEILASINVKALQKVNEEVIGWILIPDCAISYPIVQGDDNSYYLDHTWNKKRNSVGSIFMDSQVSSDFSDFNTLIYGHHMGNGTMFNSLNYYENYWWWENHPKVYIVTPQETKTYLIFSSYEANITDITYGLDISKIETKKEFIKHAVDNSVLSTGIIPGTDDLLLTLSTCTRSGSSDTRWVVHAVLIDD